MGDSEVFEDQLNKNDSKWTLGVDCVQLEICNDLKLKYYNIEYIENLFLLKQLEKVHWFKFFIIERFYNGFSFAFQRRVWDIFEAFL